MGITLAQIAANTATATFDVTLTAEDDSISTQPVTIIYYPGRVTERAIAQLQGFTSFTAETVVSGLSAFNETLAHLIKSWDVFEDKAQTQMFPLEAKRLAELPLAFRIQAISAILKAIRPEEIAPQGNQLN